jgi:N-acetylglucosaminyl-diphospho-decaprenol L-rhamnosyltransferase
MSAPSRMAEDGAQAGHGRVPPRSTETRAAVTAVVVSYNVAALLERCLRSLRTAYAEMGLDPDIVVVDNASTDGSPELVRRRFPGVSLVANERNAGFGAACNQGLGRAGEYVLFLNPDTELTPGALAALTARLRRTPRAALVGPRLVYPDGRAQPSRRRFPSLAVLLLESTPLDWRLPRLAPLRHYRYDAVGERPMPVDWLSGACLLGRTAALRQVGGFDPTFFLYFEEVDLCRRLAAYGWDTWYEPAAVVVHHHDQSAGQDLGARDRHYYRSKYHYVDRYFGAAAGRTVRYVASALFAGEAIIHQVRGDTASARRFRALARWHLCPDERSAER